MLKLWLFYVVVAVFGSLEGRADVWPAKNKWSPKFEKKYQQWVKKSYTTDIFQNPKSPYSPLLPDCADAVYSMRIIFAYENELIFAMVDPTDNRKWINNKIKKFDHLPPGRERVMAFMRWIYQIAGTTSLVSDTFPVAVNKDTVKPGHLILAKEHKHSYMFKDILENGIPVLYYSTQANNGHLLTRGWPSMWYLFKNDQVKEPSGVRFFRYPQDLFKPVWEVPGYSDEQYQVPADKWVATMQDRMAIRKATKEEMLRGKMNDLCALAKKRVELVDAAFKKLALMPATACLTAAEYDDLSTPSRDGQTFAAFKDLEAEYSSINLKTDQVTEQTKAELLNIFSEGAYAESKTAQFCALNIAPQWQITLGELRRRMNAGLISSNPNDSLTVRWGHEKGPSKRALACPKY